MKQRIDYLEDNDQLNITLVDCIVTEEKILYAFGWFRAGLVKSVVFTPDKKHSYTVLFPEECRKSVTDLTLSSSTYLELDIYETP